jgi:hypothetical protein
MKYRIGAWAIVGFLVASFWAVYGLARTPPAFTSDGPMTPLIRLTCPIAIFSSYPIRLYWVLVANATTYALVGLVVETLRKRLNPVK